MVGSNFEDAQRALGEDLVVDLKFVCIGVLV